MRLIDADALKQDLLRRSFYPAIVSTALKNAPTIDPYEWISVEERLPEKEGPYLAFTVDGCMEVVSYYDWLDEGKPFFINFTVTHWMPLPKPPAIKQ